MLSAAPTSDLTPRDSLMVGCSIGDAGGQALFDWAQAAPNLQMVCVEGNNFSAELKSQFKKLAAADRAMLVVT